MNYAGSALLIVPSPGERMSDHAVDVDIVLVGEEPQGHQLGWWNGTYRLDTPQLAIFAHVWQASGDAELVLADDRKGRVLVTSMNVNDRGVYGEILGNGPLPA